MNKNYFNRLCKRLAHKSYTASNAIIIGRKAVILVRVEYVLDVVKTMRVIGRISDCYVNDGSECYLRVDNCQYSYNLSGKGVHQSGIAQAKTMAIDKDTIKQIDYIFE